VKERWSSRGAAIAEILELADEQAERLPYCVDKCRGPTNVTVGSVYTGTASFKGMAHV
jgi:hypothetical protein